MTGRAKVLWASTIRFKLFPGSGIVAAAMVSTGAESEESSANMSSIALISASLGFIGISK
jgi:hypothetical protein